MSVLGHDKIVVYSSKVNFGTNAINAAGHDNIARYKKSHN